MDFMCVLVYDLRYDLPCGNNLITLFSFVIDAEYMKEYIPLGARTLSDDTQPDDTGHNSTKCLGSQMSRLCCVVAPSSVTIIICPI